jgi:hypothetical protein
MQDIELAADALSQNINEEDEECCTYEGKVDGNDTSSCDVYQYIKKLKLLMKPYMCAEKLKEDIVMDFLHFYKSADFNPNILIKVQIK